MESWSLKNYIFINEQGTGVRELLCPLWVESTKSRNGGKLRHGALTMDNEEMHCNAHCEFRNGFC